MIDDPFASVRPRRRTTPAAAPVVNDDPFASVAPRDTLNTYIRNTTAPEQQREPFLSRLGTAAKALGQQAINDPVGTIKGIGKGLAENAVDLSEMTFNPARASARIAVEEQGDPLRMGTRGVGAASLLLAPGMRAVGAPVGAALAADYAASAGLGAAQTPDDPAVGAILGLGMNAIADAPRMGRFLKQDMVPSLDGVTKGMAEELTPRFPMRKGVGAEMPVPMAKVAQKMVPTRAIDELANPRNIGEVFDAPATPKPATPDVFPEGASVGGYTGPRGDQLDNAVARLFPQRAVDEIAQRPAVGDAFDTPTPRPATAEAFPDGYSAEPPRRADLDAAINKLLPREVLDGQRQGTLTPVLPRDTPFPAAERAFPEGFTMPEPTPVRSATPKPRKPLDTPVEAPMATTAGAAVTAPPRVSTIAPEPFAATLTPPAAAAMPEVPTARVDAPVEPPASVAAAVEPTPVREAVPEANPVTAPSKDGTINWQTWFDKDSPGSQTAEARLRSVIESDPDLVKNARGYESMAVTDAKATAAMKELVSELTDDPLAADLPGIRAFVQKHGAAGVPAMKKLIAQNEQALQDASRVLANSTDPQEMALAQQVIDGIERQQTELFRGTIKEQANLGRGLNALKLRAKLSTDPDVWLVQAQRSLGDAPMTDAVRNEVRRLARVAADACGGA